MKFDINNPAFLQEAGAKTPSLIVLWYNSDGQKTIDLISQTKVEVSYYREGSVETTTYTPENEQIRVIIPEGFDTGFAINIKGAVSRIYDKNDDDLYLSLVDINLIGAKYLTSMELGSLDLLTVISTRADKESLARDIANAITNATQVDGLVNLMNSTDPFNSIIVDAALNKGWSYDYLN